MAHNVDREWMTQRSTRQSVSRAAGPWRPRNRFVLLPQGEQFVPAMLEAIAGARERVALEIYWIETGRTAERFIGRLVEAAGRGVEVLLLIDDYGSADLDAHDRSRLTDAGVVLARHNPLRLRLGRGNLRRDHRKILLIDDRTAFVGGAGIADAFAGAGAWRENMLRIEGDCVADWWAVFAGNWRRWSDHPCTPPRTLSVGGMPGRVIAGGRRPGRRPIAAAALGDIARARQRVWLVTPYFLPPVKLRRALARARRRGANVCLLLPGASTCDLPAVQAAGRRYYDWLLRRGVRIFEYRGTITHQKLLLADDRVLLGSSNFDRWGLRWNLEANQAIHGRGLADEIVATLEDDCAHSRELDLADWRRRSPLARLRERIYGWLEARASRVAYRRVLRRARRHRQADGEP